MINERSDDRFQTPKYGVHTGRMTKQMQQPKCDVHIDRMIDERSTGSFERDRSLNLLMSDVARARKVMADFEF